MLGPQLRQPPHPAMTDRSQQWGRSPSATSPSLAGLVGTRIMRLRIPKSLIVGATVVVTTAAVSLAVIPDALATSSVNGIWKVATVYLDEGASKAWTWNNANSDIYVG